jgi:hypothetical protein
VCARSVKGAELQELCLDRPQYALNRPVELVVQIASFDKDCFGTSAARCSAG